MTQRADINRVQSMLDEQPFSPAWGLSNPHAQTLFAPLARRNPPVPYACEHWSTPDDDCLPVYIAENRSDRPVAVLIHGLEGSIHSPYIPGIASLLLPMGYTVVAFNQRGCGGFMNSAKRLYHSGETADIEFVVTELRNRYPGRGIMLTGISLGGNQLAKWLGTHTIPDEVIGACVISPPFDLTISGPHMDRHMSLYVRHFLRSLIPKALTKAEQFPGVMDTQAVAQSRSFAEFDTHATAALHGFVDADDYYQKVSCGQFLANIRVPTLIVAAQDDPFNPRETIPYRTVTDNEFLVGAFPRSGGHVGFVAGSLANPRYWAEIQTARFFAHIDSLRNH